jgi:nickel-dependent lactate racemase
MGTVMLESPKDEMGRVVTTYLSIFNDLFSSLMKINPRFATTQTKRAIKPVLEEYSKIFKGFRLELRDLNYYRILENSKGMEAKEVVEALQMLTTVLYQKCKTLVSDVGVFASTASRMAILENYDILKKYRVLEHLPKEFLGFRGGPKRVELPYGKGKIEIEVPLVSEVLLTGKMKPIKDIKDKLEKSLERPIASKSLEELVKKGEKVAIIIDDYTRKTPTREILPPIIKRIERLTDDIVIVVATGLHRALTEEEIQEKVGEYAKRYEVIIHDAEAGDLTSTKEMLTGTDLKINRHVAEADFVLSIGTIEPHPYAGFSGGAKSLLPGVAGRDAIVASHLLNIFPDCTIGKVRGNPMRAEIELAGALANLRFIVNTILDLEGRVVDIVCGDPIQAFEAGVKKCGELYSCEYSERAKIVILTPGGYPKDSNLYLSLRALKTPELVMEDGGVIILVAECGEEDLDRIKETLEYSLDDFLSKDPRDLISFYILKRYRPLLVSRIKDKVLEKLGVRTFDDFRDALREAMREVGADSRVIVIPDAYIVPKKAGGIS